MKSTHRIASSAAAAVCLVVLAGLLLAAPAAAKDEQDPSQITAGMSYTEVAALWGAPQLKQEHESRREDVWFYAQTEVHFKEGKVTSAAYRDAARAQNQAAEKEKTLEEEWEAALDEGGGSQGVAVEDILNEIVGAGGGAADEKPNQPAPLGRGAGVGVLERR